MKKGITIISLGIVISVILILTSAVIIAASQIIESTNKSEFVAEVLNVQDEIKKYRATNGAFPENGTIDISLSSVTSDALKQWTGEEITSNTVRLNLINFGVLGIENRKLGYNNDYMNMDLYVFSKITGKVYYVQGIKYKGKTYYTVTSDIADFDLKDSIKSSQTKIYDCIFEPTTTGYTNQAVQTKIYFPIDTTSSSISITSYTGTEPGVSSESIEGKYMVRTVNSENYITNYKITAGYSYKGEDITAEYAVSNVDTTDPIIDTTNKQIIELTAYEDTKRYLTGITFTDSESGIDSIKYELDNIENIGYFSSYGKTIKQDRIDITGATYCTVYVKNKAGGSAMQVIDVQVL